jgi:hypothetical protein
MGMGMAAMAVMKAPACRIAPRLRLVCARLRINDGPTGRWNQSRIPGILMRGTVRAAL